MVDTDVEARVADLAEAGVEECALGCGRIVDEDVGVRERPRRGHRIARGDLEALQEHHAPVVRLTGGGEHEGREQGDPARADELRLELRGTGRPRRRRRAASR